MDRQQTPNIKSGYKTCFNKYFILESVNRQRLQNNPVDLDDFSELF